ncbi:arginine deiminase-related protein [Pseudomarimonas salicorniae]|uniref:Arginine deiminase-related protein n=1 Tax=Pseudomarimonas salicorniae TaxID=2933270 RepID=A0ABT0GIS5_9GAMM|nr:arginine deiminase-related protein [Lysobacter sp. CAU 1642]MCK7594438.1 arginine deiminase-related protein [Lysobacter sp. CAU 1642]
MSRVVEDIAGWAQQARQASPARPAYPRGAFLVSPDALRWCEDSASDNAYMGSATQIDAGRALAQHRALHRALSEELPVVTFPGLPGQPDGVFPNNVFATACDSRSARLLIGRMRHPARQAEAEREDIRAFFRDVLGYAELDLRHLPGLSELTGTLVIDRGRGIGIAGLSPRCDREGAEAMAEGFGLSACLATPVSDGEYHANVVLALLGSRAAVVAGQGWHHAADLAGALAKVYGSRAVVELDRREHQAFAGNCIALRDGRVWMSERAADSLSPRSRSRLQGLGFAVRGVALDEIEKAGGSLRCCVAEIF